MVTSEKSAIDVSVRPGRAAWLLLAGIVVAFAVVVWIAPNERTLGAGIKTVYVHVALTWTGMLGFAVAGVIGLAVAVSSRPALQAWMKLVGWVALPFYVAGAIMSLVAAQVNWGGVLWAEPRIAATLAGLAGAIGVLALNNWLAWRRAQGLLSLGFAVFLIASISNATLLFHPQNPIGASLSSGIQLTFLSLFALACLAGGWAVWQLRRRVTSA